METTIYKSKGAPWEPSPLYHMQPFLWATLKITLSTLISLTTVYFTVDTSMTSSLSILPQRPVSTTLSLTLISDMNLSKLTTKFRKHKLHSLTPLYTSINRKIQTTLYKKPTDTSNYLHFNSSHPKHLKESLPFS